MENSHRMASLIPEEEEDTHSNSTLAGFSVSAPIKSSVPTFPASSQAPRSVSEKRPPNQEFVEILRPQTALGKNGVALPSSSGGVAFPRRNPRAPTSYDNFGYDALNDAEDFEFQDNPEPPANETYDPTAPPPEDGKKEPKPEDWDQCETLPLPDEDETANSKWVDISIKCLKIFAYFFTFAVVLLTAVISKSVTLLMTSMVKPNHTIAVCNSDQTYSIHKELDHDKNYLVRYGSDSVHRIAWLWMLYFSIVTPYIFAFLRSVRICYFKTYEKPSWKAMITVLFFETVHCIGLSLLCFVILPHTEVTLGVMMTNAVCTIPIIIRLFVDAKQEVVRDSHVLLAQNKKMTFFGLTFQVLSLIAWTLIGYLQDHPYYYLIPISLIFASCEWWENYVLRKQMNSFTRFLDSAREDLIKSRYFVSCFVLPLKAIAILGILYGSEWSLNGRHHANMLFQNFTHGFTEDSIPIIRNKDDNFLLQADKHELFVFSKMWPLWFLFIHIATNYVCYAFAKFTCKICIQGISFAIPLSITVPVTISLMWLVGSLSFQDKCQLLEVFHPFQYIFWNVVNEKKFSYSISNSRGLRNLMISLVWLVGLMTQFFATLHIWKETSESLASTEQLFVSPMYNSVLIDQSLTMNRRTVKETYNGSEVGEKVKTSKEKPERAKKQVHDTEYGNSISRSNPLYRSAGQTAEESGLEMSNFVEEEIILLPEKDEDEWFQEWERIANDQGIEVDSIDAKPNPVEDDTIRIYACATMWHEDRNEMLQMLKACMRLDYDQAVNRIAKTQFGDSSKYFELEVNIFFDDAYEQGKGDEEDDRAVNRFVDQLLEVVKEAATQVTGKNNVINEPVIVPTPYGGKLIWNMPTGENRLIAHIKDKNLIRHRKRWSQCMYMYYLLGYRLDARKDLDKTRKNKIKNNTFILALDGDINFQPSAVHMVVDLMKKNHKLGAACGRIHPIGSGPVVWYQKFEYAVGHWLQKATEHVFGCVLCSPGCFSLFRARAVMSKSVMHKYTTKPQEAIHYVQYDQGEDRWLCTLMLQQGWRIEYSAASDSYTHAPESFGEFYTQRRRWAPSTTANILDLLSNYKETVRRNENISLLYIGYQFALMLGTVLSPGTIFLMIVSAMNTALNFDTQTSFIYNLVPILAFIFVCLKFEDNNIKINFALLLSVIYSLLMLAVLVGTGIDMFQQGILSPNSLFFAAMMGSFVIAAFLHPQEFFCLFPLPIYMLLIPSMYLLLTIYSVTNMHIVSWGTREVKSKLSAKELAAQKAEEEAKAKAAEAAKKSGGLLKFLDFSKYGSGKNGIFSCFCCTEKPSDDSSALIEIRDNILDIKSSVADIHDQIPRGLRRGSSLRNSVITEEPHSQIYHDDNFGNADNPQPGENPNPLLQNADSYKRQFSYDETNPGSLPIESRFRIPKWIRNHPIMSTFRQKFIPEKEETFWNKMITKYLLPLDEDLKEKERISMELRELRNQACFAFGFMNVIFVLFVFLLQIHKDVFGINIPVSWNTTAVFDEEEEKYTYITESTYTRMDPIGLVLVIFFGSILVIQCIGMFIHRFGTLAHLLAYTKIDSLEKNSKDALDFDSSRYIKKIISLGVKEEKAKMNARMFGNNNNQNNRPGGGGNGSLSDSDKLAQQTPEPERVRIADVFQNGMEKMSKTENFKKMSTLMRKNTINALSKQNRHRTASVTNSDTINSAGSNQETARHARLFGPSIKRRTSDNPTIPLTPGAPSPTSPGNFNGKFTVSQTPPVKNENIPMRNLLHRRPTIKPTNDGPEEDVETTRL